MRGIPHLLLLLVMTCTTGAAAQSPPAGRAAPTTEPPTIDGSLEDPAWGASEVFGGFVQREPTEGRPVSERTEVRMLYDSQALYVGAWLYDSDPSSLVLGQTIRDASLNDRDAFLIALDTYRDRQNGFVFGTTPSGLEYDGQFANEGEGGGAGRGGLGRQQAGSGGGFNLNWDGSWQVATSRDERGWYAEFRIPFTTLRYGDGGPQTWGLNFERRIRRNNEESVWAPIPRQYNLYRVSLAGSLELEAPTRTIATVTPYLLGDAFKDYTVTAPEVDVGQKIGADAKIGLNQSLTLDLTVNTDFAQAEVDDQQVNLTRFSLFYPEKRAFFLENAGTFSVGTGRESELFFSRRIGLSGGREVPIRGGARLTGRVGDVQVGLLDIQTGDLTVFDESLATDVQLAPDNNFGVLRAFKEFDNRSRLGGIFVSRINTGSTGDHNFTYGVDGQLGVGRDLTFEGWASLTSTPDSDADPDFGSDYASGEYAFAGGLNYVTRDWEVSSGYRQVGSQFNPEVGFVNRRAYRHVNARVLRHVRTESVGWFREFRPHISWTQFWSLGGFSESYLVHVDNHFAFENGAFFQLPGFNMTGEGLEEPFEIREGVVIPAGSYDNLDWEFRANTNRSAPLSVSGGWAWGGFFSGTRFGPNASLVYRFRDRLSASVRVNYFDVDLDLPGQLDGGAFTTSVVSFNGSYAFTPRMYLQANVQYNDDTENVGTNIRFGWLNTAGTGLFIVYNDAEFLGDLALTGLPSRPLQRQLVIKYNALFDLTR